MSFSIVWFSALAFSMGSLIDLSSFIRGSRVVFVSLPMRDINVFHQSLPEMLPELILFVRLSLNPCLASFTAFTLLFLNFRNLLQLSGVTLTLLVR